VRCDSVLAAMPSRGPGRLLYEVASSCMPSWSRSYQQGLSQSPSALWPCDCFGIDRCTGTPTLLGSYSGARRFLAHILYAAHSL